MFNTRDQLLQFAKNPHDLFFKYYFSRIPIMQEFLQFALPPSILQEINLDNHTLRGIESNKVVILGRQENTKI